MVTRGIHSEFLYACTLSGLKRHREKDWVGFKEGYCTAVTPYPPDTPTRFRVGVTSLDIGNVTMLSHEPLRRHWEAVFGGIIVKRGFVESRNRTHDHGISGKMR